MKKVSLVAVSIILTSFAAFGQFRSQDAYQGLYDSEVTAAMKAHVRELSAASLEGRKAGSEGEKAAADYVRVASVEPRVIDEINILQATKRAMESCGSEFSGLFLVDAVTGLALPGEIRSIIHGDAVSYMVAAASVIAKVTRDRYMVQLDEKYPEYGFARNKGYGTAEHIAAIRKYGPCPEHRMSFITKFIGGGA